MTRQSSPSDLTDAHWSIVAPLIPPAKPGGRGGRPRTMEMRAIGNAIVSMTRTGVPWEYLPHDFPKWQTVDASHRQWLDDGIWEALNDALRRMVRIQERRDPDPRAGIIDRQSVKSIAIPGWRGDDAGKKVTGRQRSSVVATTGVLRRVVVHAADVSASQGAKGVVSLVHGMTPRLRKLWGDQQDGGKLADWAQDTFGWAVAVSRRPPEAEGFAVLPRRWLVERTFGWFGCFRRLSTEYEVLTGVSEAFISAAMIHIMLRRLAT